MKRFCEKCGRRIKGRHPQMLCDLCLITIYNNAKTKKSQRLQEKEKEITLMNTSLNQDEPETPEEETPPEEMDLDLDDVEKEEVL